jgi:hypothetical protein
MPGSGSRPALMRRPGNGVCPGDRADLAKADTVRVLAEIGAPALLRGQTAETSTLLPVLAAFRERI